MIRLSNLKLPLDYTDDFIKEQVCKELRISDNFIDNCSLYKRSIDARKKNNIHFITTVDVNLNINENQILSKCKSKNAVIAKAYEYTLPPHKKLDYRPLIVGFGPAGMFAGLILSRAGANPIVVEQGKCVDERIKDVENFIKFGKLNTSSNIQFGEGGAGTFSDGKLNTGTHDKRARMVLDEFVKHGAPQEILYNSKPHIGTDNLKTVVKNIRKEIISLGGEIRFNTKLISLSYADNTVKNITIEKDCKKEVIETKSVLLAIGHSSRDTFKLLYDSNIRLEQKPFSVGARIEHLRENIDKAQYGKFAGNKRLGAATYKLSTHLKNGRGVYTFCMCPGGEVVPAASENNMVCTNGMSKFSRDCINSNSALLVGVEPTDFQNDHPLSGVELQRKIETNAYEFGGENYCAPVQRVGDFLNNKKSTFFGSVTASYKPGTTFANMDDILPKFVVDAMRSGIVKMGEKLSGFADYDALLTGAETRSSSPVRILRGEDMQSVSVNGIYPCGEGAGYAGGIVSAAVDGIKCAEKVLTA